MIPAEAMLRCKEASLGELGWAEPRAGLPLQENPGPSCLAPSLPHQVGFRQLLMVAEC